MPHGVSAPFLEVLDAERRSAWRRLLVAGVVAAGLAAAVAAVELLALVLFAGAAACGGAAGWLWQRRRTADLEARLTDSWSSWMKAGFAASSVREVADTVAGRLVRPTSWDVVFVTVALFVFEAAALVVASLADAGLAEAAFFAAGNGLLVGWVLAVLVVRRAWAGRMRSDLDEMVADGEIAVWGME